MSTGTSAAPRFASKQRTQPLPQLPVNTLPILSPADRDWLLSRAEASGFDLAGIASVPDPASPPARTSETRFTDFLASGHAGDMQWLARPDQQGLPLRGELRRAMPWARSVLVCAANYNAAAPLSTDPAPEGAGWIARYAWSGQPPQSPTPATPQPPDPTARGADYHDLLLPRLRSLEAELQARFGPALTTRCYVDTGPIVERDYAQRAGIGWIGKNTCVLNQQLGSFILLGVIVTSLDLAAEAVPIPAADRCGSCTRCIDACPTNALFAPRQMDASLCIAYLTIEKKGPVDPTLRDAIGRQVFGCDICQDVCPWNRRAPAGATFSPRPELINPALDWLAQLDGPAFNRLFRGSPLERTGRKRLLRNVAIAMGNSGNPTHLPQLDNWSHGEDPILAEAATWAAARLRAPHTLTPPPALKLFP